MQFPIRRFNLLLGITSLVAALPCGCGLSEYEGLMATAQARVRRIDEENKNLENPIKWPDKKENEKNYVDVFYRPPRGISLAPGPAKHGSLYVFPRAGSTGPIQEIWVGASTQADFAKEVAKLCPPAVGTPTPSHAHVPSPDREETLLFDVTTFDDANSTYVICICKKESVQGAVVFHLEKTKGIILFPQDKTKGNELVTKMEMSLETLGVDADAAKLRRAFSARTQKTHTK
jgi:hypothetical protein